MRYLRSIFKNHKFILILSILYCIWITILIILAILNQRSVSFYDALNQHDVSSKYSSTYPLFRYILEPLISITFILENKFTWIYLFLIFYPILRIIYLFLKKAGKFSSNKHKYMTEILQRILKIIFEMLLFGFLIIGLIISIGYLIQGNLFLDRYIVIPFQIVIYVSILSLILTLTYFFIKTKFSNIKIKFIRKIRKKEITNKKLLGVIRVIKKEAMYLIGILLLLSSLNSILISIQFTPHKIIPKIPLEEDEFLFDLHSHTTLSDGWLSPEDRILWYIEQGISGAAISDHNTIKGALLAQEFVRKKNLDFTVIIAAEWTDHENDIHINYYGIEETIVPLDSYISDGPPAMNASDLIDYVKREGGFIIVNHYNYKKNPDGGYGVPYTLTQLKDWGVDGFEITRGGDFIHYYEKIREFCLNNSLICIGTSDIHSNRDLKTFIRIKLDDPSNLTAANIFNNLKKNTHEIVLIKLDRSIISIPEYLDDIGFYVIEDFINYIFNLDSFQALSWIIWTTGTYLFFLFSYYSISKIDLKRLVIEAIPFRLIAPKTYRSKKS